MANNMKKILVVDNDIFFLKFMEELLIENGHQVLMAKDGLFALDILKTYTPDAIIILDGKGIVHFTNPAAEALFGGKTEEFLGELFEFPLAAGKSTEIDIIRKSGERAVAEMRSVDIQWEGENAYYFAP